MTMLDELMTSRRQWIDEVLVPWCQKATRKDLIKAEMDWINLAGGVDPRATLWTWAWSRFPVLTHDGLPGLNETNEVRVTLKSGECQNGYPDRQQSLSGTLVLIGRTPQGRAFAGAPISLDDIAAVDLADPSSAASVVPLPPRPLTMLPEFSDPSERV